jgi:hypothetical protein
MEYIPIVVSNMKGMTIMLEKPHVAPAKLVQTWSRGEVAPHTDACFENTVTQR